MSDIQIILNYIITNDDRLQDTSPVFEAICLPGMTEAFKLHIFIYIEEESNMRFVYVCEENSKELMEELRVSVEAIIRELKGQKLIDAIEMCETDMFSKISKHTFDTTLIDMAEVQNVLICNTRVEQYSVYNLPVIYPDELLPAHLKSLQEYERLFT
jgi:hypothetical protein